MLINDSLTENKAAITSNSCIVCKSTKAKRYLNNLKQCLGCGHVVADIDIKGLSFKNIYDINYFQGVEYYDYLQDRNCYEKNFKTRLKSIRYYKSSGKLLELGAAYGFFLNLARDYYSTIGYEICDQAKDYAKMVFNLDVRNQDFLNDDRLNESFDAIVMWDVIEHLANPQDFIAKSYQLLNNNGILALTTGDIESFFAKRQGEKWRLIHPPTHIHYFSRGSIIRLLEEHGFKILDISYPGYFRTIRQIFYNLFVTSNRRKKFLFDFINSTPLAGISIYLNTYDIMQVIAKK